jgi:multicomponent Na+:H+ antiporter subunit E
MARAGSALVLVSATYLLMLASADPVDVLAAVAVGGVLLLGFRRFLLGDARGCASAPTLLRRVAAFPLFAAVVVRDVTVGTWQVALIVLHLRPLRSPGIVAIPMGERTSTGAAVSALVATISPGELLVDFDHERRMMLLHVIDASDPDEVRRRHQVFYDRFQRKVFP